MISMTQFATFPKFVPTGNKCHLFKHEGKREHSLLPTKPKASYTLCQGFTCPSALPSGSRSFLRHCNNRHCRKVLLASTLKESERLACLPPFGSDIINPGLKYTKKRCCSHGWVSLSGAIARQALPVNVPTGAGAMCYLLQTLNFPNGVRCRTVIASAF